MTNLINSVLRTIILTKRAVTAGRLCLFMVAACVAFSGSCAAFAQAPVFLPTITTIAGSHAAGNTGNGGPATSATFSTAVQSVTADSFGNLYISDQTYAVVRRVDAVTGLITVVAGNGTAGFSGDGGPATSAQLKNPYAARYFQGSLYICDAGNDRIRVVNLSTGIITTFAGNGTLTPIPTTTPTPATSIAVNTPSDMAFDTSGNLYYAGLGGQPRVVKINVATGMATLFAGTGAGGHLGDGGPAVLATLNQPQGLAVDVQGNVYIAEALNKDVRIVANGTNIISTYAGYGTNCAAASDSVGDGCPGLQATFTTPLHMGIDAAGALYVADNGSNRIRKIAPGAAGVAGLVTTVAGTGATPGTNDGSYPQNAAVGLPVDASFTPAGDLMIVDRSLESVRIVRNTSLFPITVVGSPSAASQVLALTSASTGTFTLPAPTDFVAGTTSACTPGVNVTGQVCAFGFSFQPTLAGYRSAPVVFTDSNGSARLTATGLGLAPAASLFPGIISTLAGNGVAGSTGDGASATAALLNMPSAVAFDGQGNLYVADTKNNEVRRISAGGVISRIAGTGVAGSTGDGASATTATLNAPSGIAADGAGNVYIADTGNNKIRSVDAVTGNISTLAGTGMAGYSGDTGLAANAQLNAPTALALTSSGVLYVADTGNNVVRSIGLHSGSIATFAGTGVSGFSGDGGTPLAAQLSAPAGVAVDTSNNVYIADTGNNRIRVVTTNSAINTIAGIQGAGFNGDGPAISAKLSAPSSLVADAGSNLYVADTGNNRIRILSGGQIKTVAGTGSSGFTGDSASSTGATLNNPHGITLDATGNLVVADTANDAIRKVAASAESLVFPTTNPQTTSVPQTVVLYNSGNGALAISSVTVPSGFVEQSSSGTDCNGTAVSLTAGMSCNLQIAFAPAAQGNYAGSLVVTDNAESVAAAKQTIVLSGTSAYVFTASFQLPSSTVSGMTIPVTVSVINPQQTYTGTLHFTSTDKQAVLPADYTYKTTDAGMHAFSVTLRTAGSQCVTVTDIVNSQITATSCATVTPGAAASISASSGSGQSTNLNSNFAQPLTAYVTDAAGNPLPNATVTFTAPTVGAHATFSGGASTATALTNTSGLAISPLLTADSITGSYTISASVAGVTTNALFSLTNISSIPAAFTLSDTAPVVATLLPGVTSVQNLTVTPVGGFYAAVNLTCSAPAMTTCSISPASAPATDGVASAAQLTFQSQGPPHTGSFGGRGILSAVLACLSLFLFWRKKVRIPMSLVLAILVGTLFGAISGCGSSTSSVTNSGVYIVTVTGTSGTQTKSINVEYDIGGV